VPNVIKLTIKVVVALSYKTMTTFLSLLSPVKTRNSSEDELTERDIALYFAIPLAVNAHDGGDPWDDLRKILR